VAAQPAPAPEHTTQQPCPVTSMSPHRSVKELR
jgi:hypothetical protein